MNKYLDNISNQSFTSDLKISGSKSESNRLLILQQQFKNLEITNLGNAVDVLILQKTVQSNAQNIDIGHAGTAMRFLTAYFATKKNTSIILSGSNRMQKRPLKILVDALRKLGADIKYLKEDGFPPLQIRGKTLIKDKVQLKGNVSSQYISALLLIAPSLKNGLTVILQNEITSKPYIAMTLSLLNKIDVKTEWLGNRIKVYPKEKIKNTTIVVESDWSSASYFYSLVALSKNGKLNLSYFKKNSIQGDQDLIEIYASFGIKTIFTKNGIKIEKVTNFKQKKHLTFNLIKTPDIAQTIIVTCLGLGISCDLTGLHTLKIKETDRLEALKIELTKLGAKVQISENSIHLKVIQNLKPSIQNSINTYQDHRMAMAFAPLSLLIPIIINNAAVVHKSYPNFWNDLERIKY
ncbi:MAG: 3-phosphoshikimate 1-carboxyvinyltransferase [Flavobacteriaceae bacterium]|nr:3-phosphoshikimate 1-carboxyvinyltransferase [Flavobacteriaceae bacterium]